MPRYAKSVLELSDLIGVPRSTLQEWKRLSWWPDVDDHWVRTRAIVKYLRERVAKVDEQSPMDLAKLRRAEADAGLAELRLEEASGELVRADEVRKLFSDHLSQLLQAMIALPPKVAPLCEGGSSREIEGILEKHVRQLADDFSTLKQSE